MLGGVAPEISSWLSRFGIFNSFLEKIEKYFAESQMTLIVKHSVACVVVPVVGYWVKSLWTMMAESSVINFATHVLEPLMLADEFVILMIDATTQSKP